MKINNLQNKIYTYLSRCKIEQKEGIFLQDKSHGFDLLKITAEHIINNLNQGKYDKNENYQKNANLVKRYFNLRDTKSTIKNYVREPFDLLKYSFIISEDNENKNSYNVKNLEILNYISNSYENAYIFLYLLVLNTFKNANLLENYKNFCIENTAEIKEKIVEKIFREFSRKNPNLGKRKKYDDILKSKHARKITCSSMNILNMLNKQKSISVNLKLKEKIADVKENSINNDNGKSAEIKNTEYLKNFNYEYVFKELEKYEISNLIYDQIKNKEIINFEKIEQISESCKKSLGIISRENETEQKIFYDSMISHRSSYIQMLFKKELLKENKEKKCSICKYEYEDFLTAAHIIPISYTKDMGASSLKKSVIISKENGLLLCPTCDRMFESSRKNKTKPILMSINPVSLEIEISPSIYNEKCFQKYKEIKIKKKNFKNKKNTLNWHYAEFKKTNSIQ